VGTYTKGFTLIELLMVMAITSILAAIAFLTMADFRFRAIEATMQTDLRNFATAMEAVRVDCNDYSSASIAGGDSDGPVLLSECRSPQTITKSKNNIISFSEPPQLAYYGICVTNSGAKPNHRAVATTNLGGFGWGTDCPQAIAAIP
jgi:prepilin-type N-terminal cleavage/methylation domain-containing protein